MKTQLSRQKSFWDQFGFAELSAEEFKKRTTAVQLAIFTALGGVIYCLIYFLLGFPSIAYVVYAYIIVCMLNLLYLRLSHQYATFGIVQLGIIFLFPLAAQISIGGFVEASAVVFAAFLAPAGALLYASRRVARISFGLFCAVIAGAAWWEYQYGTLRPTLPRGVILLFFGNNIITICAEIYVLIESFLQKQKTLRNELAESLATLQATQAQLIHAAKMASLGELTAGIAHEIQNPLNFVNNFSEVSAELLQELLDEQQNPDRDPGLEAELVADLRANLDKITHHGQRAAGIVRSMLEHARPNTADRVPTDFNALVERHLELAYHGFRTKDKAFVSQYRLLADASLPAVNVASQEIGRVLLNLFGNAFYATRQRARQDGADYQPNVTVSTRRSEGTLVVEVRDNGIGMSSALQSKVFQPFFTTKPTGEGTGLGLSLSYDIITKSYNGTLDVASREGEGTTFTVTIPLD